MTPAMTRQRIHAAVKEETRRGDSLPQTAHPRLALRVGLAGHRPQRLLEAWTRGTGAAPSDEQFAALEQNLARRLETVLLEIQRSANAARRELAYKDGAGGLRGFYTDEPPLIRLVSGAALGVDALGMDIVDTKLRGPLQTLERRIPLPRRAPREGNAAAGQAEWQIDMILPFGKADFVQGAWPDFVARHAGAGWSEAEMEARFAQAYRWIFDLPDTTVGLPPFWRRAEADAPKAGAAPEADGAAVARRVGATFGAFAEAPTIERYGASEPAALQLDYRPGGRFLVRQIDVLVVVWDCQPARGAGGAPDIAAAALEQGVPVVCIDPSRPHEPAHMVQDIERIAAHHAIKGWQPIAKAPILSQADACVDELAGAIFKLVEPPADAAHAAHGHAPRRSDRQRTIDFLQDEWPATQPPRLYRAFQNLLSAPGWATMRAFAAAMVAGPSDAPAFDSETDGNWTHFINSNPDEGYQAVRLKHVLHRRYALVDALAVKYADLYRGAFIKAYLWAALAVVTALAGVAIGVHNPYVPLKLPLMGFEIFLIWKIQKMVRTGEHAAWHERFLHYRGLAESLRHLRFLATFAEFGAVSPRAGGKGEAWWLWYLRATTRELGLPEGVLGPTYQRSLLKAVLKYEVLPQIGYHTGTERRETATEEAVHKWAKRFFTFTLVMLAAVAALWLCVDVFVLLKLSKGETPVALWEHGKSLPQIFAHVVDQEPKWFEHWFHPLEPFVGFVAAALPTLGAALACIRFTADFEGKASRSRAMIADLETIKKTLCDAMKRQEFDYTSEALRQTARAMSDDVQAFLSLYGLKPLILPG